MSSFNDYQTAERIAHESRQHDIENGIAPHSLIYAKLTECAASHFENGDTKGAVAILNALSFTMQEAAKHTSARPLDEEINLIYEGMQRGD